jgi:hypothetical protein
MLIRTAFASLGGATADISLRFALQLGADVFKAAVAVAL